MIRSDEVRKRTETRKLDAVIEVRLDRRYLAMAALAMSSQGVYPTTKSEVVRCAVESLATSALEAGLIELVETTHRANEILSMRFGSINRSGRGMQNLMHNLQTDREEIEGESLRQTQDVAMERYRAKQKEALDEIGRQAKLRARELPDDIVVNEELIRRVEEKDNEFYAALDDAVPVAEAERGDQNPSANAAGRTPSGESKKKALPVVEDDTPEDDTGKVSFDDL